VRVGGATTAYLGLSYDEREGRTAALRSERQEERSHDCYLESSWTRFARSLLMLILVFLRTRSLLAHRRSSPIAPDPWPLTHRSSPLAAFSRSDYSSVASAMNVEYLPLTSLSSELPNLDVVVLACSILSFEKTVSTLFKTLPDTPNADLPLIVDVLSVKEHPRRVLLNKLPPTFDILCTHPMFGPESGKNGWSGLNFVYERTRIAGVVDYGSVVASSASGETTADVDYAVDRCERFLSIFEEEGCRMVPLSCESHDRDAANSQFITHLVGRILGRQGLDYTPIDTKGFESVMKLIEVSARQEPVKFPHSSYPVTNSRWLSLLSPRIPTALICSTVCTSTTPTPWTRSSR